MILDKHLHQHPTPIPANSQTPTHISHSCLTQDISGLVMVFLTKRFLPLGIDSEVFFFPASSVSFIGEFLAGSRLNTESNQPPMTSGFSLYHGEAQARVTSPQTEPYTLNFLVPSLPICNMSIGVEGWGLLTHGCLKGRRGEKLHLRRRTHRLIPDTNLTVTKDRDIWLWRHRTQFNSRSIIRDNDVTSVCHVRCVTWEEGEMWETWPVPFPSLLEGLFTF